MENLSEISRRKFIRNMAAGSLVLLASKAIKVKEVFGKSDISTIPTIVAANSPNPGFATKACIKELGGMSKFVKKNDVVVIKPNIAFDRRPEQAATTNPDVIAALIQECLNAGAKTVKVFDRTCNDARRTYETSGISKVSRKLGADVHYVNEGKFHDVKIPGGVAFKSWPVYDEARECDVFINVPILKQHAVAKVTMGFKNLMGIAGGNRGIWHRNINNSIVDLNSVVKVHLTVLDAYRVLINHGPTGGRLEDVKLFNKIVIGTDRVAVDVYGAKLFGISASELPFIKQASEVGLGEANLEKVSIKEINV
ncbi:MAG: DUF362 domain-containing protein [Candidatus Firestonebacteria bacterium]